MNRLQKFLSIIPNIHNWLSDRDFIWWPFSFLRPSPSTFMTLKHTVYMTGCFGGLSFVMFTGFAVVNNMFSLDSTFITFLMCFGGFFAWFNIVTKPLWNYRARRLNK